MQRNYRITKIADASLESDGSFIGLQLETLEGDNLGIALLPEAAHILTLIIRSIIADGTNLGILPTGLHPSANGEFRLESTPNGSHLALDLSDGQMLEISLSHEQTQSLAKAAEAVANSFSGKPRMN